MKGFDSSVSPALAISYRGVPIGHHRPDFIVEGKVILEIKSVARFGPVFFTQVVTYLKVNDLSVGLLLNLSVPALPHAIKRFIHTV
jgi:GxxExxY protein